MTTTTTNYAVAPGAYLEEWIDENGLSQQRVADMLGCSRKQVNEIINARAPITADTAMRLERVVGIPADAWLRYEALHKADQARIAEEQELATHADRIDTEAAKYLRKIGATTATKTKPGQLVSDFLTFHRCGTWGAYELLNETASQGDYALAALKQAADITIDSTLLSTWLRAGEQTEHYEAGRRYSYDPASLRSILPDLRERAAWSDSDLLNDLAAMLARVGVVFVVVEPPAKFPLLGMTRWIDKKVPVIQQTGRWGKDGFIIWTLFHEIGHVLNDPRGEMHLDFKSEKQRNSVAEKNANGFARDLLFGEAGLEAFQGHTSDGAIARIAREVGVSPGVAVHQMHRMRLLDYKFGNHLCVDLSDTFTRSPG
ncbi:HigA family addiction module antitoxin [Nocardioides sp. Root140]|uniref:HigA family addiction module antitoxin n=1 Tax=Nocardioides sp. Root140 TaxID=1736460 RepID=UPI000701D6DB|nr:HigA family addiction module antitoxin [Nocardioides sp. Root140]KQY51557.1 HigA family addiction module antidote protein [Nocardioides sp. Root140]